MGYGACLRATGAIDSSRGGVEGRGGVSGLLSGDGLKEGARFDYRNTDARVVLVCLGAGVQGVLKDAKDVKAGACKHSIKLLEGKP